MLMVRMENVCRCDAAHIDGWTGRRLRRYAKVGSGICVMSVLFAIFFRVKNCPQRVLVFSGAGSIRKMPEDVFLVSAGSTSGSLSEEDNVIAVA